MNTTEIAVIGGLGVVAAVMLTKGKVGNYTGEAIGQATGGTVAGFTQGMVKSILVEPYEWASNYEGYIPVIDDAAKAAVWFKGLGNDDKWLW